MTTAILLTKSQIISEIEEYMSKNSPYYNKWYVGIATNPRTRLFSDHNVDESNDCWIFRECADDGIAREIEDYFLRKGCDGGGSGGDSSTKYVYAYLKNYHTKP